MHHSHNLSLFKSFIEQQPNFLLSNIETYLENIDYDGYSFKLNDLVVQFRTAKVTPKKVGQFVAFYKRLPTKIIAPFDMDDGIDLYIIFNSNVGSNGFFVFLKETLVKYNILSQNKNDGKRGFRVYLPSDNTSNKQAIATQEWQTKYYLDLNLSNQKWQYGDLAFSW